MDARMAATAWPSSFWPSSRSRAGARCGSRIDAAEATGPASSATCSTGATATPSRSCSSWTLNTHSPASLDEAFPPEEAKRLSERLEIHHTPKHGSWLTMAEIELSAFSRDLPDRIGDQQTLRRHAAAWAHRRNATTRAEWQLTTADARIKLRKLYPTMAD